MKKPPRVGGRRRQWRVWARGQAAASGTDAGGRAGDQTAGSSETQNGEKPQEQGGDAKKILDQRGMGTSDNRLDLGNHGNLLAFCFHIVLTSTKPCKELFKNKREQNVFRMRKADQPTPINRIARS